jgi:hypothetical protein
VLLVEAEESDFDMPGRRRHRARLAGGGGYRALSHGARLGHARRLVIVL